MIFQTLRACDLQRHLPTITTGSGLEQMALGYVLAMEGMEDPSIAVDHSGDDHVKVAVEGGLDLATVEHLTSVLELIETRAGVVEIILDLGGVTSVDSYGLEPILTFGDRLDSGCQLTILPSDCVQRLLFMLEENLIAQLDQDGIVPHISRGREGLASAEWG